MGDTITHILSAMEIGMNSMMIELLKFLQIFLEKNVLEDQIKIETHIYCCMKEIGVPMMMM